MFCVRGFGGWLGFLLFWGLFWLSAWFFGSRVRGCLFVLFLVVLLRGCAGGGLRVVPGSGVDVVRPVSIDYRVLVGGWACFFPLGALCSSGSGVGLRGLVGVGVLGGVGLGWGFFSGFCCSARACLGWGCSGFVWRV